MSSAANVGIYVQPKTGDVSVTGNVLPSACNVYDLGSAGRRWKDLYLSGNTIDLGGTKISRDAESGGIRLASESGQTVDSRVKNLYADGTITASNLNIVGDYVTMRTTTSNTEMMVIENAGTGPALKVTQTGVNSIAEFYDDGGVLALKIADGGNVGIGTSAPLQKLHVQGGCILENAGTGPALKVTQTGVNSIAEFYDDGNVLALKIADGGNVGIGTSMPITKLDVVGILKATGLQINDITNAFMPRGGIIMWSGSIATIPTGWAICDGTNGTPNLYNRFVIGAGSTYNVAATGGSTTKSLQIDNLPSHNHTGTTALAGNHAHTVTVGYYNEGTQLNGFGIEDASSSFIGPVSAGTDTQGNHTHTFTTNNTGSGTAFDITPPYYALAYIMKL